MSAAGADAARDHAGQCPDPEVFNISKVGKVAVAASRRHRGTRRQCPADPRQRRGARRQAVTLKRFKDEVKEVASARNAAWRSRITATCVPATSSNVIAWRPSSALCESKSYRRADFKLGVMPREGGHPVFPEKHFWTRNTGSSAGACHPAGQRRTGWRMMTANRISNDARHQKRIPLPAARSVSCGSAKSCVSHRGYSFARQRGTIRSSRSHCHGPEVRMSPD